MHPRSMRLIRGALLVLEAPQGPHPALIHQQAKSLCSVQALSEDIIRQVPEATIETVRMQDAERGYKQISVLTQCSEKSINRCLFSNADDKQEPAEQFINF